MEVLPLTLSATTIHYVYIRKHEAKPGSSLPGDRTLFASNLPVDCTERQLSQFFKANGCGTLEKVVFSGASLDSSEDAAISSSADEIEEDDNDDDEEKQPVASTSKIIPLPTPPPAPRSSGHTAHIIFLDSSSIPTALSLSKTKQSSKKLKWPPLDPSAPPTGLARLIATYDTLRPPASIAREHADSYMEAFEVRAEAARLAAQQATKYKKGEAIVDEDGFTLVTRGGAYGATLGGGAGVASRKFQLEANSGQVHEMEKKKRKQKEKTDFYTFQLREKKRKDFMDLRRKFEEDKAKIMKLKESRRFKPY
ncbi:hypothetical protein DL93DRAFT_2081912 [Clavulina sp. PMI_390]|nr:hypothetical protein DL93DRAFT_2081912 [Clavulina sp. PMI_390]